MKSPIGCQTEYDSLQRVIVCEPTYMEIQEVINEVQEQYKNDNIDKELATKQHRKFTEKLEQHGVEVIRLQAQEKYPEQVFTRDIGFTIGNTILISKMESEIRQGEQAILQQWLNSTNTPYQKIQSNKVEGGDVLVDGRTIFIGVSKRTSMESILELETLFPGYEINPVPINEKYLHLDCVFNILSPEVGLIFPSALAHETIDMLSIKYELIEVEEDEQFTMGANVLSIGNKKVISLPQNKKVNEKIRAHGFEVIEVEFDEIIKSGGSFRCCTMPILRG
jgi:N-dimethylarginine dimethylaminohydrolase